MTILRSIIELVLLVNLVIWGIFFVMNTYFNISNYIQFNYTNIYVLTESILGLLMVWMISVVGFECLMVNVVNILLLSLQSVSILYHLNEAKG